MGGLLSFRAAFLSGVAQTGFINQRTGTVFATPQAAVNAALTGDTILVSDGPFTVASDINISQADISFVRQNTNVQPKLTFTTVTKGCFHRTAGGSGSITIDGLEIVGPGATDSNESVQWEESHTGAYTFTIRNSKISNLDNGIIMGNRNTDVCVIDKCEIFNCGSSGSQHNVYIGEIASATVRGLYSHDCTAGHLFKCRALVSLVEACRFDSGSTVGHDDDSREMEFPCGGDVIVRGCEIIQRAGSGNSDMVADANENIAINCQAPGRAQTFQFYQNTVVNYRNPGVFFVFGGALFTPSTTRTDNIFAGTSSPTVANNSTFANDTVFVNAAAGDFRLSTPVGGSGNFAPFEYVHPNNYQARTDSFRGARAGAASVTQPLWITTGLGSTPNLLQFISVGTHTFTGHQADLLEGTAGWIFLSNYGPGTGVRPTGSIWLGTGQGHPDSNNVMIGCRLEDDVPTLYEVGARTPIGQRSQTAEYYTGGRYSAFHAYGSCDFNTVRDKFVIGTRSFTFDNSGQSKSNSFIDIDPITGAQTIKTPVPISSALVFECSTLCDPAGNTYINVSGSGLWKHTQATDSWARVNTTDAPPGTLLLWDSTFSRIIAIGGNGSWATAYALQSEGFASWHTIAVTGDPGFSGTAWGGCYDTANGWAWVVDNHLNKNNIRKLTFPTIGTATCSAGSQFTGVTLNATEGAGAGSEYNGRYSCMRYVPALKGIVMYAGSDGGLYFAKTHA